MLSRAGTCGRLATIDLLELHLLLPGRKGATAGIKHPRRMRARTRPSTRNRPAEADTAAAMVAATENDQRGTGWHEERLAPSRWQRARPPELTSGGRANSHPLPWLSSAEAGGPS